MKKKWKVTAATYEYLKKKGMAKEYLDMIEIIDDYYRHVLKYFEEGKKVEDNL